MGVVRGKEGPTCSVLRGQKICTTGLTLVARSYVEKTVKELGGEFLNDFSHGCTHLIATEAGTYKYLSAVRFGVPVVTLAWLDGTVQARKAASPSQYALPALKGMLICGSGLTAELKDELERHVKALGGKYSAILHADQTHILVTDRTEGDKYVKAKEWEIPIVRYDWIEACETRKVCMPPDDYPVEVKQPAAAPLARQKSKQDQAAGPRKPSRGASQTLSSAPAGADRIVGGGGGSSNQETQAMSGLVVGTAFPSLIADGKSCNETEPWVRANEVAGLQCSLLLGGCVVYLAGLERCTKETQLAVRGLLHKGGAMPAARIDSSVTHVVVAHPSFLTESVVDKLNKYPTSPSVVSRDWLFDSVVERRALAPSEYAVLANPQQTPPPEPKAASSGSRPPLIRRSNTICAGSSSKDGKDGKGHHTPSPNLERSSTCPSALQSPQSPTVCSPQPRSLAKKQLTSEEHMVTVRPGAPTASSTQSAPRAAAAQPPSEPAAALRQGATSPPLLDPTPEDPKEPEDTSPVPLAPVSAQREPRPLRRSSLHYKPTSTAATAANKRKHDNDDDAPNTGESDGGLQSRRRKGLAPDDPTMRRCVPDSQRIAESYVIGYGES